MFKEKNKKWHETADGLIEAYRQNTIDRFELCDYVAKLSKKEKKILMNKYPRIEGIFKLVRLQRMHSK